MKELQKKSIPWRTFRNRGKITQYIPAFSLIFLQNTASFEKYVKALVRTFFDFKTRGGTRLRLVFLIPLGVWKSEEILQFVFDY